MNQSKDLAHVKNNGGNKNRYTVKKLKLQFTLGLIIHLLLIGCADKKEITLKNKAYNRYNFKDRFEISLPYKYYFSGNDIYDMDSTKMGEVVIGYEQLKQPLNSKSLVNIFKNHQNIKTTQSEYESVCEDCTLVKTDSVTKNGHTWFYTVAAPSSENGEKIFRYGMLNDNHILEVKFFNPKVDEFVIGQHTDILRSIEIKEKEQ